MGRSAIRCCDCHKSGDSSLQGWGDGWEGAGRKKPEHHWHGGRLLLAIRPNVRDKDKRYWICRQCLDKKAKLSDKEFKDWIMKMDQKVDEQREKEKTKRLNRARRNLRAHRIRWSQAGVDLQRELRRLLL